MFATMVRQGCWLQLEQSNMLLALNIATMVKGGFSSGTIEETQCVIKETSYWSPRRGVSGCSVSAAFEGECSDRKTPGDGSSKSMTQQSSLAKWHSKGSADMFEAQRNGYTSTRPTQTADTRTDSSSTQNATAATQWQSGCSRFPNWQCATQKCEYTYYSSQSSVSPSWCIQEG